MNASSLLLAGSCLLLSLPAQAVLYQMDLSGSSVGDALDGLDGWAQSEPNFVDGADVYPRSYVTSFVAGGGSSLGFSLGGYYDTEPSAVAGASSISVSHPLVGLGLNTFTLTTGFQFIDSETAFDPDRNSFTIGLYDPSGGELMAVGFEPVAQSPDPDTDLAIWNVYTSVGGVAQPAFSAVVEGGAYLLDLTTASAGVPGQFAYSLSLAGSNTVFDSGVVVPTGSTDVAELRFTWNEDASFGGNALAVSSVTVVPEPAVSMLGLIGMLGLLHRRR